MKTTKLEAEFITKLQTMLQQSEEKGYLSKEERINILDNFYHQIESNSVLSSISSISDQMYQDEKQKNNFYLLGFKNTLELLKIYSKTESFITQLDKMGKSHDYLSDQMVETGFPNGQKPTINDISTLKQLKTFFQIIDHYATLKQKKEPYQVQYNGNLFVMKPGQVYIPSLNNLFYYNQKQEPISEAIDFDTVSKFYQKQKF